MVARAVGSPSGIVAGQAWESEPHVDLVEYQQAKTGALFAAATVAGAAAAGAPPLPWRLLGECLGEAYQVADDLRDVACRQEEIGKPAGRDATLGRPNAAALLGMGGALDRLNRLTEEAIDRSESWVRRVRNEGIATATRIRTGMMVQATSIAVLCVVRDGVGFAFSLNLKMQ